MQSSTSILTHTGRYVDLANPRPEDIDIRDIAHALSQCNRFTGHTNRNYSVAEHSLLVARFAAPEDQLEALMHDASEAYLGDMTRPLKNLMPEYCALEARWVAAIEQKFHLKRVSAEVKELDHAACEAELDMLVNRNYVGGRPPTVVAMREILGSVYEDSRSVELAFVQCFNNLMAQRYLALMDQRASDGT